MKAALSYKEEDSESITGLIEMNSAVRLLSIVADPDTNAEAAFNELVSNAGIPTVSLKVIFSRDITRPSVFARFLLLKDSKYHDLCELLCESDCAWSISFLELYTEFRNVEVAALVVFSQ